LEIIGLKRNGSTIVNSRLHLTLYLISYVKLLENLCITIILYYYIYIPATVQLVRKYDDNTWYDVSRLYLMSSRATDFDNVCRILQHIYIMGACTSVLSFLIRQMMYCYPSMIFRLSLFPLQNGSLVSQEQHSINVPGMEN